jgi:beta-glucanase (GH16 family)
MIPKQNAVACGLAVGGATAIWLAMAAWSVLAVTPSGPPTWSNPDQPPWGVRRPVTGADRASIAGYRSGRKRPIFSTNFIDPQELHKDWDLESEDKSNLKSCRRPQNVVTTSGGLELQTLNATDCTNKWSTGHLASKARYRFGFFEASMKAGDISGLNNAFWLTTDTTFEMDIPEIHYPNVIHMALVNWGTHPTATVGFNRSFRENLSQSFHDYGALWTPTDLIFEVDGEPMAAITTTERLRAAPTSGFRQQSWNTPGRSLITRPAIICI